MPPTPEKDKYQTLCSNISPGHSVLSKKKKEKLAVFVSAFISSLHYQSQANLDAGELCLQGGKNGQREASYFLIQANWVVGRTPAPSSKEPTLF